MITLNISTAVVHNKHDIYKLFIDGGVECQITKNISTVNNNITEYILEKGYTIKIFNFNRSNFKEKIWEPLALLLQLQCGFVIEDNEYMGCVKNWPNVFVPSKCQSQKCNN